MIDSKIGKTKTPHTFPSEAFSGFRLSFERQAAAPDSGESGYGLATPHRIPAVVAQVAIPVSHRDRSAAVAGGGVLLERGELLAADGGAFAAHREGGVEGF